MQVKAPNKIRSTIVCPPDKSISQRAAILSLLSEQKQFIKNYSTAADPQSALSCVEVLGAKVQRFPQEDGSLDLIIEGLGRENLSKLDQSFELDCGNSGTAMRLLSGLIAGAGIKAKLIGDASLQSRTMKRIITPLRELGANITGENGDYAPLLIDRGNINGGLNYSLPVASAQLKSCLLLAGLFSERGVVVHEKKVSRDHTERMLGLTKQVSDQVGFIHSVETSSKTSIPNLSGIIPSDFSAAAFWIVAGLIHPDAEIVLPQVGINETRSAALNVLMRMGGDIELKPIDSDGEPLADIIIRSSNLKATFIEEKEVAILIDEIPILSVAMAFADGVSEVRKVEELRHKETDRIEAIFHLFDQSGISYRSYQDGFEIVGNPTMHFDATTFKSFHDHRIAMSAAILSFKSRGVCTIIDSECHEISYPTFKYELEKIIK